jgi:hypothetical protein
MKLDKEEQEILNSFENGEWKRMENPEAEIQKHRRYAKNTLVKEEKHQPQPTRPHGSR